MTNTVDLDGGWIFRAEQVQSVTHEIIFDLVDAPAIIAPYGRAPFQPDNATVVVGLHPEAEDSGHLVALKIDLTGYRVKKDGTQSPLRVSDARWWHRKGDRYSYDDTDPAYVLAVAAHAVETVKAMLR